jgi:hypothetical protein
MRVDEFLEVQRGQKGPGVAGWWERVLPQLDDGQYERLMDAARAREIGHRTIAIVLGRWGHDVSLAQVAHWRRNHVG